ncbi:MAG: translation initiation factor IF-2 [Actinobacteria bacterium]|nr:translation initiation factor IF-2 [Actinomycetota bacterium]
MTKKRVYEIAKESGLATAEVVERLKRAGMSVSGNFASVDEAAARKALDGSGAPASKTKAPPKPAAGKEPAAGSKKAAESRPVLPDAAAKKQARVRDGAKAGASRPKQPVTNTAAAAKAAPPAARTETTRGNGGARPKPAGVSNPPKKLRKAPVPAAAQGKRRRVIIDPSAAKRRSFVPSGRHQRVRHKGGRKEATAVVERPVEAPAPADHGEAVKVNSGVTVKELASLLGSSTADIMKRLMSYGEMATITQSLSDEAVTTLADDIGRKVEIVHAADEEVQAEVVDNPEDLVPRAPVVTIMGHVDHGKTSLLDAIRETEVTATEVGGITQHIGAYQVEHGGKKITFLDTPGHEAFTAMRARGAKVTDVAVLVVAADDGVMPQTIEAIDHSKAAGVPVVVAVNKIDKPEANPDRVRQELSEQGLIPEDWGGDTIFADVSAKQRIGLDSLMEMILLVSEVQELKANPSARASGVVIESKLDPGRGVVATVLINRGTLHVGDAIVAGQASGKVKAMNDFKGRPLKEAGPSVPVEILGFDSIPQAGEYTRVVEDERRARILASQRSDRLKAEMLAKRRAFTLDDVFAKIKQGEVKDLNLIVKADVAGSVEALEEALRQIKHEAVKVNIIHSGVGAINESDVMLAAASQAIVIGFNVRPNAAAKTVADIEGIDVRTYGVIYKVTEDVKAALIGMLEPTYVEEELGEAEVRQTFKASRLGTIAGCYVTRGKVTRNAQVRVVREGTIVWEGKLASLKRFKEDTREVEEGYECGVLLEDFNDIKEGDVLEFYQTKEVKPG